MTKKKYKKYLPLLLASIPIVGYSTSENVTFAAEDKPSVDSGEPKVDAPVTPKDAVPSDHPADANQPTDKQPTDKQPTDKQPTNSQSGKGTVKVIHKMSDNTILSETVLKDKTTVGDEYKVEQKLPDAKLVYSEKDGEVIRTITTYTSEIPANAQGKVVEGETVVTFIYTPHQKVEKFPKERILSEKPINAINHYLGNPEIDFKKQVIKIKPKDGVLVNKETIVIDNDVLVRKQVEDIKTPQVDGLIEVGNKTVKTSDINFEKEYKFNDKLPSKSVREVVKGVVGKNIISTLYTVDEKTGDLSNPVEKTSKESPVNEIIEFNNLEIKEVDVPFNTVFKANDSDISSTPKVMTSGVVGKSTRTTVYNLNRENNTFDEGKSTDKVTVQPKNAVIGVGNKELVESKKVNHAIKYVPNDKLKNDEQIIVQKGSDSVINEYKIYSVDETTGKLSNPIVKKETISTELDEIIQVAPNSHLLGQDKDRKETKDVTKINVDDVNIRNKEIVKPIVDSTKPKLDEINKVVGNDSVPKTTPLVNNNSSNGVQNVNNSIKINDNSPVNYKEDKAIVSNDTAEGNQTSLLDNKVDNNLKNEDFSLDQTNLKVTRDNKVLPNTNVVAQNIETTLALASTALMALGVYAKKRKEV